MGNFISHHRAVACQWTDGKRFKDHGSIVGPGDEVSLAHLLRSANRSDSLRHAVVTQSIVLISAGILPRIENGASVPDVPEK
jgi:hypothetical protein